ncbi:101_t:CDS:1, partial [Cetraspora pellucida]
MFQGIFEESGFEVYKHHELVMKEITKMEQQKKAKNLKLTIYELHERVQDKYWHTVANGNNKKM